MNNKHCDIIKDLLPLYVDGLTSEQSGEAILEHLATCESCTEIYETLKTNNEPTSEGAVRELDYLKKIKAKRKKLLLITVAVCTVVFCILTAIGVKTYIIGTPVSISEISYENDEGYSGIGTKFNPGTNELTLYGELLSDRQAVSGIKVEESSRLVGVYNVTVYAVPRFSEKREHDRQFKKVIKIPDDNTIWSVYSIGEIPQDTYQIWSNAEQIAEKYQLHQNKLMQYLGKAKGLSSENGFLEWADFGEYGGENCHAFYWYNEADDFSGNVFIQYAVSEDGNRIYEYDNEKNTFVNAEASVQPKIIDVAALWNARTKFVGDNAAVGRLIGLLPVPNGLSYDHFELHTGVQPYGVEIVYSVSSEVLKQYDTEDENAANPFRLSALLLLALIDNCDQIQYTLTDGSSRASFIKGREWTEDLTGKDVRSFASNAAELQKLVDFPFE